MNTRWAYISSPTLGRGLLENPEGVSVAIGWGERECSVSEIDFMVKLLRACVGMPRRRKAKKDVVSCEKPRGDAHSL